MGRGEGWGVEIRYAAVLEIEDSNQLSQQVAMIEVVKNL